MGKHLFLNIDDIIDDDAEWGAALVGAVCMQMNNNVLIAENMYHGNNRNEAVDHCTLPRG